MDRVWRTFAAAGFLFGVILLLAFAGLIEAEGEAGAARNLLGSLGFFALGSFSVYKLTGGRR